MTRRSALRSAALSALALPLVGRLTAFGAKSDAAPGETTAPASAMPAKGGLKLGLATYTLAKLPVDEVIAAVKRAELKGVSLYKTHVPWSDGTPTECKAIVAKFTAAGIPVTSTGMIDLPNDETALRKSFDNVQAAGLDTFCGWLKSTDSLPLVDRLVKEYDLKIAVHNHGPTEALATGMDVWKAVQPFDARIGLCLDVGHGFRAGEDAPSTIRTCRSRLYQVHLRDTGVRGGGMKDPLPVVIGHGLLDFPAIIAALNEIGYSAMADFEYEKKEDDRVPGLSESVGYIRGIEKTLARS